MIAQLAGSLLIVCASSKIGFDSAARLEKRVKEIRAFENGCKRLQREIGFCQTLLADALEQCGEMVKGEVGGVFTEAAELLKSRVCHTARDAWQTALKAWEPKLHLQEHERSVLQAFGQTLGTGEGAEEVRHIDLILEKLKQCEEEATQRRHTYGRLYRGLGITAGLFLAVLFI